MYTFLSGFFRLVIDLSSSSLFKASFEVENWRHSLDLVFDLWEHVEEALGAIQTTSGSIGGINKDGRAKYEKDLIILDTGQIKRNKVLYSNIKRSD